MWQLEEIKDQTPDTRRLFDMKDIIFDKPWLQKQLGNLKNHDLYYMFRGIVKVGDEDRLKKAGLRYDITVIPGFMMGVEFVKTAGHYHPIAIDDLTYPEVYQVLEGEAIFFIQKVENFNTHNLLDVAFARAKAGDVFVVPPNYGHITINTSRRQLVLANWTADSFESLYEPIRRMCGASYFYTKDGWVRNHRYGLVPKLRELRCKQMDDMYGFALDLEKLAFLRNPTLRQAQQDTP